MLRFERDCWDKGFPRVAGIDEAGRGPLAGPVLAAAVILDKAFAEEAEHGILNGLTDSKKLTEKRRESFFSLLMESPDVEVGVGVSDIEEIDRINILRATHAAMVRAVQDLSHPPDYTLVDGLAVKILPPPVRPIVRGDSLSLSISAASIVAKVLRDRRMKELDKEYPEYGFARHKGYASNAHLQALFHYGPSPIHRNSFRPVREAADIRRRATLFPLEEFS